MIYPAAMGASMCTSQCCPDEARGPATRILHVLTHVGYGGRGGMPDEEAAMFDPEAFALYRTSPAQAACPLGERLSDAQQRMIDALRLIGSRHAGEAGGAGAPPGVSPPRPVRLRRTRRANTRAPRGPRDADPP